MRLYTSYSFLLFIIATFIQVGAIAQSPDLKFKNYDNINGIENRVSVVRDSSGYIWLTGNGIARFDGAQLKAYRKDENQLKTLRTDNVNNVVVDRYGTLWFCADGLCYYECLSDGFVYLDENRSIKIVGAEAMVYDGNETLWFCSNLGLCSVNVRTKRLSTTLLTTVTYPHAAAIDHAGRVWICSLFDTISVYNPSTHTFNKYVVSKGAGKFGLTTIFVTKQNKLWVGKSTGMFQLDPEHPTDNNGNLHMEELRALQGVTVSFWARPIQYMPAFTGDSIVWMATSSHGLVAYNVNTQKISACYRPDKSNPHTLSANTPRSLYVDKDNHLWITQSNGLSLLNTQNQNFKSRVLTELDQPYATIHAMEADKDKNDIVWMGTNYGLIIYNWKQKKTIAHLKSWGPANTSTAAALSDDGKGSLWIGSGNTLYRYNKSARTFTASPPLFFPGRFSYQTEVSNVLAWQDTVLLATTTGLAVYLVQQKKYKPIYTGTDKGLDSNSFQLFNLRRDNDGVVWCVGAKGLVKVDLRTEKCERYLFNVQQNFVYLNRFTDLDFNGDDVVIAASAGVLFFNKKTRQFRKLSGRRDAALNNSWYLHKDSLNNLWVTTYYGLLFINHKTGAYKTFTAADGLPRSFSNVPLDMVDNKIVFKWRNKFAYIDPYSVQENTSIPQPVITDFKIYNQPVLFDPATIATHSSNLSYKQNFLSFDFTAFEFNYPDKVSFAYRLRGLTDEWIYCGKQRTATFANLPGGQYTFELKAANSEGRWSKPLFFKLSIRPAFWQTTIFRLAAAAFLFLLLYLGAWHRIKQVRIEAEHKAAIQKTVTDLELRALRSQMNPHFIFNSLNSIQKFIWENKQEDAAAYLGKFAKLMRLILDHSMHRQITLEQELAFLSLYLELEHRRSNNKYDYTLQVSNDVPASQFLVPPMIFQPYIENAIWHGLLHKEGRGCLSIKLSLHGEWICCIIEDDGIGRKAAAERRDTRPASYGMQLTEQRLRLTHQNGKQGRVQIEDKYDADGQPAGTCVIIHLPVTSFTKLPVC